MDSNETTARGRTAMTSAEVADRDHSPVAVDDGWTCDVCGLPVEVGAVRHLEAPE